MARKKYTKIDLNNLKGFAYAFQFASDSINSELLNQMNDWAQATKKEYDAITGYGNGFKRKPQYAYLKSFSLVEKATKGNGLYVAVGHECFIARFLEVGTDTHTIKQKQRGIEFSVKGIHGSKALSKIWNANQKNIPEQIENMVKNAIFRRFGICR